MTALDKFDRLETEGLWRSSHQAQRQNVIVSLGEASLVLSDNAGRALAHWSLPAVVRINPGQSPALFSPSGDDPDGETLELSDPDLMEAISHVQRTIARRTPRPGRLRRLSMLALATVIVLAAVFWLPRAVIDYTARVLPQAARDTLDGQISTGMTRLTGQPCAAPFGLAALRQFEARLGLSAGQIEVRDLGRTQVFALPGGRILLDRRVLEDTAEPDVAAGFVISALADAAEDHPLRRILDTEGVLAAVTLLTGGALRAAALDRHVETLLTTNPVVPAQDALLPFFGSLEITSTPYAYARDITGESVLTLVEADPKSGGSRPRVLSDGAWLSLQAICDP